MNENDADVHRHIGPMLLDMGFVLDEIQGRLTYKERPAWAVFYRREDGKLQVCWSAREGSTEFMLAKPFVANTFGLDATAMGWHFLLMLSDFDESLVTPSIDADAEDWWQWRQSLLQGHLPDAVRSLSGEGS